MERAERSLPSIAGAGLRRSVHTGWLLIKIILPLSAGVALLQWTGILTWIGRIVAPAMGLFGLPGEASVALLASALVGVYGGVAAASVLALTKAQMTVLALMALVAHNLVVESTIQSRSGASGWKVSLVRIGTALLLGAVLWQTLRLVGPASDAIPGILNGDGAAQGNQNENSAVQVIQGRNLDVPAGQNGDGAASVPFSAFALAWARSEAWLVLKIFAILAVLMVVMEAMRAYGTLDVLAGRMRPVMRLLGLSERVAFLWLTATFLGVSYGAGLIIEEAKRPGRFRPGDLRDLHVSVGISHSMLEDTLLFAAIGANPFWVLAPRPIASAAAVRVVRRFFPDRAAERVAVRKPGPEVTPTGVGTGETS